MPTARLDQLPPALLTLRTRPLFALSLDVPQILLGLGMQALHETPLLYRQQIANVTAVASTPQFANPTLRTLGTGWFTRRRVDSVIMSLVDPDGFIAAVQAP